MTMDQQDGVTEAARPEALTDALGTGDEIEAEIQSALADPAGQEQAVALELETLADIEPSGRSLRDLDILGDVEVEVTVEFGRIAMPLGQLLQLRRGSLVELARRPEQHAVVKANGTPVAYADIVLVGSQVGVHIVELVDPQASGPPMRSMAQADFTTTAPGGDTAATEFAEVAGAQTEGDATP